MLAGYNTRIFMDDFPVEFKEILLPSNERFTAIIDEIHQKVYSSLAIPADALRVEAKYADVASRLYQTRLQHIQEELTSTFMGGKCEVSTVSSVTNAPSTQDITFEKLRDLLKTIKPAPKSLEFVSSVYMVERKQYRFPKTKKKRIRRKWAKRSENYRNEPMKSYYIIENRVIAHPTIIEKLKRAIAQNDGPSRNV